MPGSVEFIGADLFGRRKAYSTIIASAENAYARSYAAANHIHVSDHYTEEMYRRLVEKAANR